jgi:hypothetical protein
MKRTGIALLDPGEGRNALKKKFRETGISISVLDELVKVELENQGKRRRHNLMQRFDAILEEALGIEGEQE